MNLLIIGIILVLSVLGLFTYIHSIADTELEAAIKKWEESTTSDCPYVPMPENITGFDPTICEWVFEKISNTPKLSDTVRVAPAAEINAFDEITSNQIQKMERVGCAYYTEWCDDFEFEEDEFYFIYAHDNGMMEIPVSSDKTRQQVLERCSIPDDVEQNHDLVFFYNVTHYIDNGNCQWEDSITCQDDQYRTGNECKTMYSNEEYDNKLVDVIRSCDSRFNNEINDLMIKEWTNSTHFLDNISCQWQKIESVDSPFTSFYQIERNVEPIFTNSPTSRIFDIPYTIQGGTIKEMVISDMDNNSLFIKINSSQNGYLTAKIPYGLLESYFDKYCGIVILNNGEEIDFDFSMDRTEARTITMNFTNNDPVFEIMRFC